MSIDEVLIDEMVSSPTAIYPGGEEEWHGKGSDFVVTRLKPHGETEHYNHVNTKEIHRVISGVARFNWNGQSLVLRAGQSITFLPTDLHSVSNLTNEDVIIFVRINIPCLPEVLL